VKVTADTNLLLRAIMGGDLRQAEEARAVLGRAEAVAVPPIVVCELVWTLRRFYKRPTEQIAEVIDGILGTSTIVTDRGAIEAGLAILRAGGDFADGVISWQGAAMGADLLATFDKTEAALLSAAGMSAAEPSTLLANPRESLPLTHS
jgi:predicted nucleic-acid-binding protein